MGRTHTAHQWQQPALFHGPQCVGKRDPARRSGSGGDRQDSAGDEHTVTLSDNGKESPRDYDIRGHLLPPKIQSPHDHRFVDRTDIPHHSLHEIADDWPGLVGSDSHLREPPGNRIYACDPTPESIHRHWLPRLADIPALHLRSPTPELVATGVRRSVSHLSPLE